MAVPYETHQSDEGAHYDPPPLRLDPIRVKRFRTSWALHERWFQNGRQNPEQYTWPVPGTRAAAFDGQVAYYVYRDATAEFVMRLDGFGAVLDALTALVADLSHTHGHALERLLEVAAPQDATFHRQWQNLFEVSNEWDGLSHADVSLYARKYEVEWPLCVLVHLKDLLANGRYDDSLARFRDRAGRLKKGQMVEYLKSWPPTSRAIGILVEEAFSPRLRNAIGHNGYELRDGRFRSLDGEVDEGADQVLKRMNSLTAIQNALVWLVARRTHPLSGLRASGVLAVGWGRETIGGAPRLEVLQLAAFRARDIDAEWASRVDITVMAEHICTRIGDAPPVDGGLSAELRVLLRHAAERGSIAVDVVGVVPCLHCDNEQHVVHQQGPDRYCEVDYVQRPMVPFTVSDSTSP